MQRTRVREETEPRVLVNGVCLLVVFAGVVKSKSACRVVEGGFFPSI